MNSLIRRASLLQLRNQQALYMQQRIQPMFVGSHWQPGNKNVYNRKPKIKTLHYKKAELMAVLHPIRPDPDEGKPMWETCGNVTNPEPEEVPLTQYEKVLRNELVNGLHQSKFVAIVAACWLPPIERKRCDVYLGRKKMVLRQYKTRVLRAGLLETEYENLLPLFDDKTYFCLCREPTLTDMLNIFKRYPQFVVLGGFLEGRLLSRTDIEEYARLPSLDIARAQFVSVLNSASMQLLRTLGTSQSMLLSHLESRIEELKKESTPTNTPNETVSKPSPEGQETKS